MSDIDINIDINTNVNIAIAIARNSSFLFLTFVFLPRPGSHFFSDPTNLGSARLFCRSGNALHILRHHTFLLDKLQINSEHEHKSVRLLLPSTLNP